jgi:hypothetical protein
LKRFSIYGFSIYGFSIYGFSIYKGFYVKVPQKVYLQGEQLLRSQEMKTGSSGKLFDVSKFCRAQIISTVLIFLKTILFGN